MKAACHTRVAAYAEGNRAAGGAALSAYADLYGRVQRRLFADMAAGRVRAVSKQLKPALAARHLQGKPRQ